MKKILITLSLLLIFVCTSCDYDPVDFVSVGTFYSDNWIFNNKKFPKAKYIITEIAKEEYDSSNNVNVFIDASTKRLDKQRYLKVEFYLYSIASDEYIQGEIIDLKHTLNKFHIYEGLFNISYEEINYNGYIILDLKSDERYGDPTITIYNEGQNYLFSTAPLSSYKPIELGTFYSSENITDNEYFSKAKYVITEITKEEYDSSNNVNVFIDDSLENLKKQIYLKIEFYLYSIANDKYIQVETTNIKPINKKVHYYYGNFKIIDENIDENIDFSGRIYLYLSEGSASNNRDGFYLQNEKYECIIQCRGMNLEELIKEEGNFQ